MADDVTNIGSTDAGGIRFTLEVINKLSSELKTADRDVAATVENQTRDAAKISQAWDDASTRQVKAIGVVAKAHRDLAKSMVLPKITSAATVPVEMADLYKTQPVPKVATAATTVSSAGLEAPFPEALANSDVGKKIGDEMREATDEVEKFAKTLQQPTGFDQFEKMAVTTTEQVSAAFKKSEMNGLAFVETNRAQIEKIIDRYRFFGKEVPKALQQAIDALDKYEKKVKQAGDTTKKTLIGTIEQFLERAKSIGVGETVIGGFAFSALKKLPEGFGKAYEIGSDSAKTMMTNQEGVLQRARDTLDVITQTGAEMEDLAKISAAFSTAAVTPFAGNFKEAAKSAVELSHATGLSMEAAGKLTTTMQQYYGLSGKALDDMVAKTALIAKNSLLTVDEQANIYEQLKFVGFGLSENARASENIATSTVKAAAGMSLYGMKAETVVNDIRNLTEGGMEEGTKGLQALILGGASPEEAMQMLADLENGVEGAAERIQEFKNQAAVTTRGMFGNTPMAGFAYRDLAKQVGIAQTGEEANRRVAAGKGILAETAGAKALAGETEADKAAAMKPYYTKEEETRQGINKSLAALYKTQESVYMTEKKIAEEFNKVSGTFATFIAGFSANNLAALGWVTEFGLAVLTLKMIGPQLKTLFGIGGDALGKTAIGGAGELAGAGGKVAGAGGLAGILGTSVSAASVGAIAATVVAGAAIGGVIGTLIDQLTNKIPFLKTAKEWTFDRILETFTKPFDVLSGKVNPFTGKTTAFEGTKTEAMGMTDEKAAELGKKRLAERQAAKKAGTAEGVKVAPGETANVTDIEAIAGKLGATVTSTTGGEHSVGSKHYAGMAADIRTKDKTDEEVENMISAFKLAGYKVLDERKPTGGKGWSAEHLHVEATPESMKTDKALSFLANAAVKPFTGKTQGDDAVIAELRRTNALMAQQLAILQKKQNMGGIPSFSPESDVLDRGGMGG